MVLGPVGKFLGPIGLILVLVAVGVAILSFVFILLDLSGDFVSRIETLNGATGLVFVIGGAALVWLGKP